MGFAKPVVSEMRERRTLYPWGEPFDAGWLPVSGGHEIYYEQCGCPEGQPALFLHGGPGAGIQDHNRGYFDPGAYRVMLFEQRGAGRSRPSGSCQENTTWDLVDDMERLRERFRIERWLLFGGSWGSTLALAYAGTHPHRVTGMVLRGIFLGTEREIRWLFRKDGAALFYPERFQEFLHPIPEVERDDLLAAYHRRLLAPDPGLQSRCAQAWSRWEAGLSCLLPDEEEVQRSAGPEVSLALARLEAHYLVHRCFLEERPILSRMDRIGRIPAILVQGRYDMICPPEAAWVLHRAWSASRLEWVADAGHSASEPGILDALVRATDSLRA
ncbi:MAG: prolyl aminopeptidase [Acidobacteriota bacterium]